MHATVEVSPTLPSGRKIDSDEVSPASLKDAADGRILASRPDRGINRLPEEILSHIFMLGGETFSEDDFESETDDDSNPKSSSPTHFATLCSHVCKYWRDVAIDTPQLWELIEFAEGPPFEKSQEWISRSKAVPLDLDIEHTEPSPLPSGERPLESSAIKSKIAQISSLIMPHSHRWRSLNISADVYDIIWIWEKQLESCPVTPCLEHLGIFCHEDSPGGPTFYPTDLTTPLAISLDAPRLRSVVLWGVHIDWDAATFLRSLISLTLAYHTLDVRLSTEQFVRVLTASPNLEDLSLEGSAPIPGSWPYERIALNSLQKLALIGIDIAISISIVGHLEFPALRDLTLDFDQDDSVEQFIAAVCKDGRPRFRDVEALKLTSFPCSHPSEIVRFLKSMPKILSLTLNFNYLGMIVYRALVGKDPRHIICPKVDTLKLSGLQDDQLRKIIRTRTKLPGVEPIRRLYLDAEDEISDRTVDWLKKKVELVEFYEPSDDETEDEDDEDDGDDEEEEEEDDDDDDEEDDQGESDEDEDE